MKAVIVTKYGGPDVLKIMELPTPEEKENELLIRIHAASVNSTDPVFRKGKPFISRFFTGFIKPKNSIPGDVLAGEVVSTGKNVVKFKAGERVYGYTTKNMGAHAEYKCLPEYSAVAVLPDNVGYEEAAGIVDGGLTALAFLRDKAEIKAGQKVLIYGASGSVGTAAVQLAVYFGAEVTGVCSTGNIELVKSLGAKHVIDYTKEDFEKSDNTYDIIFDTVAKKSFGNCRNALTTNGIYLTTFPSLGVMFSGLFNSKSSGKRGMFMAAGLRKDAEKEKDLIFLSKLLKEKKIRAVIDKVYLPDEIAEAHQYVERGHKKGNVVLKLS